ncbi:MAG: rhodanese-like domain-containing protein [Chloroflexota bacterium]
MGFLDALFGPAVPAITAEELSARLKVGKHPLVLDVRQPSEFKQVRIAGARLIPLNELRRRMDELPANREIFCICDSGSRSKSAARMLIKAGYKVTDVTGGMHAWRRLGLPVQKG